MCVCVKRETGGDRWHMSKRRMTRATHTTRESGVRLCMCKTVREYGTASARPGRRARAPSLWRYPGRRQWNTSHASHAAPMHRRSWWVGEMERQA